MQDDAGREENHARDGQQDAHHGVAHGELGEPAVDIDDIETQGKTSQDDDHPRQPEEQQRPVLADQVQDTVQNHQPLPDGGTLGWIGVANGDGHFHDPKVMLMGEKLHL